MTDGVPAPGAPAHLDPGATGGGFETRPQPGWGGARNPGCQPPRKPRRRWGRGRSPQPLPSLAAGGGGKHRGRAATSAALGLAGQGHVSAPPRPRGRGFRALPRVVYGVTGDARPRPVSRDPRPHRGRRLARSPASRAPVVAPVPPTRLSVRVQHGCHGPQDAQSACVRVCLAWGRGGTGRARSRGAQAQCARSLGADLRRAMGVAGARGPAPRWPPPPQHSPPRRRE